MPTEPRDRRRPAGDRGRARARIVGAAEPPRARRRRRGARPGDGAARVAAVSPARRRSRRAVRRRGRAGDAADDLAVDSRSRSSASCRSCRRPTASRRPGSSSAGCRPSRRPSGRRAREPRARRGAATTEPVEIDGKSERVRDVVTVGVTDSSVRLVEQPLRRDRRRRDPAGAGRAGGDGVPVRWRNLAPGLRAHGSCLRSCSVSVRGQREALGASAAGYHRGVRRPCRARARPLQLRVQVDPSEEFGVGDSDAEPS